MAAHTLKRQFIRDSAGNPVGVILPLEEFALVEETLKQRLPVPSTADKLAQMERAANDALFMADLREAMSAFDQADVQWLEPAQ
jgi:PHD/YefM family antitoxin component YafN of YafNO toxin-antitoxin module